MKAGLVNIAMTIGLPAAAMTGNAPAGEGNATGAVPEGAFIQAWVHQGAIETGALPDTSNGKSRSNRIVSGESAFSFVNIGGVRYRVGLDTGP